MKRTIARKKTFSERATNILGSEESLIIHTIIFIASFIVILLGANADRVLLVLTTLVSLEAIYLSLFIQISVNRNTSDIADIQEEIEDIAEDVEDIAEDVESIEKDIDEIADDVETIGKDIDEIQEDVENIEKDIDEIAIDEEDKNPIIRAGIPSATQIDNPELIQKNIEYIMLELRELRQELRDTRYK